MNIKAVGVEVTIFQIIQHIYRLLKGTPSVSRQDVSSITRATLVAVALAAISGVAADITVKVSGPENVASVDNFTVKTIVSNTGVETVTLLNDPNSILTPKWKTNTFGLVGPNGVPAKFGGIKVKWSPTLAAAHGSVTTLEPGQTIELNHVLNGVYNLTESGAGAYTINAKTTFQAVDGAGKLTTIDATVVPHAINFSGKLASSSPVGLPPSAMKKRAVGYNGCSSSQKPLISTAASSAQSYITSVNSYLSTLNSDTTRYTTWFGAYTSSRAATIKSHFSNINSDPGATTYDCTCTETDTYAYVYAAQPGYVYLCGAFWNAPNTGTDSRAGTIVHEQSHFTNNGGTQDYAYGQTAAKSLAKSNPARAIMNADS